MHRLINGNIATSKWLIVLGVTMGLVGPGLGVVHANGILFAGSDYEEFSDLPDEIGKYETSGPAIVGGGTIPVDYNVNGMTVVDGLLLTGTVGTPHTTAADGQTLRTVDFNGVQQSSATADLLTSAFNEDIAYDGTSVWHAHFNSETSGQIRELDPNNLGGSALSVFDLGFGVVGMEVVGTTIWITDWAGQMVGTWDAVTNTFTPVFATPSNAGGLAYDPTGDVLWVGLQGGLVQPYNLLGVPLGPGFKPFGDITATIDGLAFAASVPEPGMLLLVGSGLTGFGLWRKWKAQRTS